MKELKVDNKEEFLRLHFIGRYEKILEKSGICFDCKKPHNVDLKLREVDLTETVHCYCGKSYRIIDCKIFKDKKEIQFFCPNYPDCSDTIFDTDEGLNFENYFYEKVPCNSINRKDLIRNHFDFKGVNIIYNSVEKD